MTTPTGLAAGRDRFNRKRGGSAPPPSRYALPDERDKQAAAHLTQLINERDATKVGAVNIDGWTVPLRGLISWQSRGKSIAITEDRPDGISTIVPLSRVTTVV